MGRRSFERLVERALRGIPAPFARHLETVRIIVQDEATDEQLALFDDADDPVDDLLGLYDGVPIEDRSSFDEWATPVQDTIYVFRLPHEDMCSSDAELEEEVRKTVIHEIAHHFGLDEDDVARHGYE